MAGLVLSLKANEKFLVNGALLQNGDKRGQIHLPDSSVNVLRLSDCLHPDEAHTPVRRAYYLAQLILSGDVSEENGALDLLSSLNTLNDILKDTEAGLSLGKALLAASAGRYYSVLCSLKRVFDMEDKMLASLNLGLTATSTTAIATPAVEKMVAVG